MSIDSEAAGQAYNIAFGGREYLIDIYHALTAALDKDIEPKFGPDRKGDIKHSNADISKAKDCWAIISNTISRQDWLKLSSGTGRTYNYACKYNNTYV